MRCTDVQCTKPRRVTVVPGRVHRHRTRWEVVRMKVRRIWAWLGRNPQTAHVMALAALVVAVTK